MRKSNVIDARKRFALTAIREEMTLRWRIANAPKVAAYMWRQLRAGQGPYSRREVLLHVLLLAVLVGLPSFLTLA